MVKDAPEPRAVPPVAELYQLIVPALAAAEIDAVEPEQMLAPVDAVTVGAEGQNGNGVLVLQIALFEFVKLFVPVPELVNILACVSASRSTEELLAVRGANGGVKEAVYTAEEDQLKFVIFPVKYVPEAEADPIVRSFELTLNALE